MGNYMYEQYINPSCHKMKNTDLLERWKKYSFFYYKPYNQIPHNLADSKLQHSLTYLGTIS